MYMLRTLSLTLPLALSATLSLASGDGEHRQHGAHVHGIAQMNLAVDGNSVLLELTSPAMNIVGFEYMPSSEEDRHAVHEAAEKLEAGDKLFVFSKGADCTLMSADVESPLLGHDHEEAHDHEDSHGDSHDKDNDHHDAHGKGHDEEPHDKDHDHSATEAHGDEEHSEFEARYEFTCKSPQNLKSLTVNLFTVFPGFEEIETQILTGSGQSGAELTSGNNRVKL